ncbi:S1 family peptidase [Dysgonomonas sp. OttesenSCG-928-D17]|nr:S1 family peptidase [Dysgonomonas sp. OttesenSCG-928-D17]
MRFDFLNKLFVSAAILFTYGMPLISQTQYTIAEDRSKVSLQVDFNRTKFTVSNILSNKRGQPLIEAKSYTLKIDTDTLGVWSKLPSSENTWKLQIEAPYANGFFVSLDDFYLPEGSRLYVYNGNNLKEATVYKHEDNPEGGPYSLENLRGDNVVLEYVASAGIAEKPRIKIADVGLKYEDNQSGKEDEYDHSDNVCMINVNCPQGDQWQSQKRGIVRLRLKRKDSGNDDIFSLCTGTLINNTAGDKKPYILTASHCFENVDITQSDNFHFFFEYESPTCTSVRPTYKYHRGAEVKVINPLNGGSDGALMLMTGTIPDYWDVYFNGWDRVTSTNSVTSGAILHHPKGDIKKITLYDKSPRSGGWDSTSPLESFWMVNYSEGSTTKGSSGAAIFNQNGLVVGTLSGGSNSCENPDGTDYYGKFWYHFDRSADTNLRMSTYLDPLGSGAQNLAGLNNNNSIDKELVLDRTQAEVIYRSSSVVNILSGNGNYSISSADERIATASISGNEITINGINMGNAVLTITDGRNKTKELYVQVRQNIDFFLDENKNLRVSVYDTDDAISRVRLINLYGNTMYDRKDIGEKEHTINLNLIRRAAHVIEIKTVNGLTKREKILW